MMNGNTTKLVSAYMRQLDASIHNEIIVSKKLVDSGLFSTKVIHEFEIQTKKTRFGYEELTKDIPNVVDDSLLKLDNYGFIKIGSIVVQGDIIVGCVRPKGESELTPEEKLLRAIFLEKAIAVADVSLRVPFGKKGKVVNVIKTQIKRNIVNVKVLVEQEYRLRVGDVLTDTHGQYGTVIYFDNIDNEHDLTTNFQNGEFVARTNAVENILSARSTGPYSIVSQKPISFDGYAKPQLLNYDDLIKFYNNGLIDVYQNMMIFQTTNAEARIKLYESIIKGYNVDFFELPYFDILHIKTMLMAICIDLCFIDKNGDEIEFVKLDKYCVDNISIKFRALTDQDIEKFSCGEVVNPETLGYRTNDNVNGGLFCEKIFGTTKDWQCRCGKYKSEKCRDVVCDKCGTQVTMANVRWQRMGHIKLATPIKHPFVDKKQLNYIPVIPANFRPMVEIEYNKYASSELNELYRKVVNRNNRLKRLIELNCNDVIIKNEIKMLENCIDKLFFGVKINGDIKSLMSHIRDCFTTNIGNELVDYSASCGVCVDDTLTDEQCELPIKLAVELFKPFIIKQLMDRGVSNSLKHSVKIINKFFTLLEYAEIENNLTDLMQTETVIIDITEKVLQQFNVVVIGQEKDSGLLVLKPMLSKNMVMSVNNNSYKMLNLKIDESVKIFLPAHSIGQKLLSQASKPTQISSVFDIEKEYCMIKEVIRDSFYGGNNLASILKNLVLDGKKHAIDKVVSKLVFGVLTDEVFKMFQPVQDLKQRSRKKQTDDEFDIDKLFEDCN